MGGGGQRILLSLDLIGRGASALEGSGTTPAPVLGWLGTMEGSRDASPIFISCQGGSQHSCFI